MRRTNRQRPYFQTDHAGPSRSLPCCAKTKHQNHPRYPPPPPRERVRQRAFSSSISILSLPFSPPPLPAWVVGWAVLCIWPSALLRKRIRQEAFLFLFLFLSLPLRPPSSPAWAMGWVGLPCGCGIVGVFSYDPGLERLNYFLPSSSPFSFVFLFRY